MPCRTNRLRVTVPREVPSELQWAYDTTRPLDDDEVKKASPTIDNVRINEDNVLVECNTVIPSKVAREVPYYASAEDDDDLDEVPLSVFEGQAETALTEAYDAAVAVSCTPSLATAPSSPVTATTSATAAVELPNLESEVHHVFPSTAAMPPPPPTTTASIAAVRFWHRRLLAHPTYARCVRLLHRECPAPPTDDNPASAQAWMTACDAWWDALSAFVSHTSSTYKLPTEQSWNPYSLSQSVTYTKVPTVVTVRRAEQPEAVQLTASSARYFLPPPPAYHMVVGEYRRIACEVDAVQAYVECLTQWWRKACQWAAAANREHAWVNPPPTTGATAEDWATQCELWRSTTATHLREEERRAKATELEAMMLAYQMQQYMDSSCGSSSTTYPSQGILW